MTGLLPVNKDLIVDQYCVSRDFNGEHLSGSLPHEKQK